MGREVCYAGGMKKEYSVIVPALLKPRPSIQELSVAYLLAEYFGDDVYFVLRDNHKTADYKISGQPWELKTLEGSGKRTIQHALHKAVKQSVNIVIDARRTKLDIRRVRSQLIYHAKFIPRAKRVLLIEKDGKVVEIK